MNQTINIQSKTLYQSFIESLSKSIGFSNNGTEILIFVLSAYILFLIIIGRLYNTNKKLFHKNKERFFLECDHILYLFAKDQHQNKHIQNTNNILIETIMQSKSKDYFLEKNIFEIQIKQQEQLLPKTIVQSQDRKQFYRYYKKSKIYKTTSNLLGRIMTIMTLGIYRIFM